MTNEQQTETEPRRRRGGGVNREAWLAAAAEPFTGISTDGVIVPNLFKIEATGVSTAPIREAAEAFLDALGTDRDVALFPIDGNEWRMWSNIHRTIVRHGACFMDMTEDQVDAGFGLLAEALSLEGFTTALDIMALNYTIGEMTGRLEEEFGDRRYWLSIFGKPSDTEPWGFQMDGHHLNLNFFVLRDQVVMTPIFMGSEPCYAESGKYAGTRVFAKEETTGLTLMRSLTKEQQTKAWLSPEMDWRMEGGAFRDNFELRLEGVPYRELRPVQQRQFLDVVKTYVGRMRPGHAEHKLLEIQAHLNDTYFAWQGPFTGDDCAFYYRVHSPVILIEFDHQRGTALPGDVPSRTHIHTVVRTPNGNDYGKDLLRQHLAQHHQ